MEGISLVTKHGAFSILPFIAHLHLFYIILYTYLFFFYAILFFISLIFWVNAHFCCFTENSTGAGNPYVKLIYDKQKQKTQILKHSEDARWREIFYLCVSWSLFVETRRKNSLLFLFLFLTLWVFFLVKLRMILCL